MCRVVNATPRPLYARLRHRTHCIGGWVASRVGVDECGKSPDRPAVACRYTDCPILAVACRYTDCGILAVACRYTDCPILAVACRYTDCAILAVACRYTDCATLAVACRYTDYAILANNICTFLEVMKHL